MRFEISILALVTSLCGAGMLIVGNANAAEVTGGVYPSKPTLSYKCGPKETGDQLLTFEFKVFMPTLRLTGPAKIEIEKFSGAPEIPQTLELGEATVTQIQSMTFGSKTVTPFGIMAHDKKDAPALQLNVITSITKEVTENGGMTFTFESASGSFVYRDATGTHSAPVTCASLREPSIQ